MVLCIAFLHSYACKSDTSVERPIADACNTIRYRYACKSATVGERIIADACDTFGDNKIGYKLAVEI